MPSRERIACFFTVDAKLEIHTALNQLFQDASSLRILDLGITEAFDTNEPVVKLTQERRDWISMENAELWFRNEKSIITQRIQNWHEVRHMRLGYYLK